MRIRELPLRERPASRIADHGPDVLSDAELLALVSGQHDLDICAQACATTTAGSACSAPTSAP